MLAIQLICKDTSGEQTRGGISTLGELAAITLHWGDGSVCETVKAGLCNNRRPRAPQACLSCLPSEARAVGEQPGAEGVRHG